MSELKLTSFLRHESADMRDIRAWRVVPRWWCPDCTFGQVAKSPAALAICTWCGTAMIISHSPGGGGWEIEEIIGKVCPSALAALRRIRGWPRTSWRSDWPWAGRDLESARRMAGGRP